MKSSKRASELLEEEHITYVMNHDKDCKAIFLNEDGTIRAILYCPSGINPEGHSFNIEGTPSYIDQVQINMEEYGEIESFLFHDSAYRKFRRRTQQ